MKSPLTGKEMKRMVRKDQLVFRKETFSYLHHYYLCLDSNEEFTDEELDTINLNQVYNQYREKYNLPFPDEIKNTREQYGLSAAKMSEVLGLGINHYRLYENGDVPSISNARLIQAAKAPFEFKKFLLASGAFKESSLSTVLRNIDDLIAKQNDFFYNALPQYLMGGFEICKPSLYTGYITPNLDKVIELLVYFTQRLDVYKTKLNILLFYTDFYHFKHNGFGITGLCYRALQWGPIAINFDSIYEYAVNKGYIEIIYQQLNDEKYEEIFLHGPIQLSISLIDEFELSTAQYIIDRFCNISKKEIIQCSHQEKAWIENVETKNKISYEYAFELTEV
ncbi:type II toxin-antitoxin system antitoxin SocA domain-containing protein [Niastella populi]|uniref:HTH cro/C1-type domain-containing protein n=1 Tax=Niastella populi TaxID=550983 RepID=A0A1V9EPI4_9BACT|nr:type II toxin-antitoxin system antitoxin SocA domain-containing protein [Niastella populi]OQP47942.1 hypothetical protein A4R26_31570 [Niastella populi]